MVHPVETFFLDVLIESHIIGHTLAEYYIVDGCTIKLEPAPIPIFVKTLAGQSMLSQIPIIT